jgi:pentatricopeptide repeat protein
MVALEEGRYANEQVIQSGWDSDVFVGNCLVDMYAKRGSMEDAWRVSNKLSSCYVVSWNAILGGCAMHGHGKEALILLEWTCEEGVQPDDVTFVCLLSACSHAGLVAKGMHCYASMIPVYMVSAKLEHGTCMVNVLGCAGHLKEAENMINVIPHMAPWKALLSACRILGNLEMGKHDAKLVLEFWSLKMLQVMFCCQTSMLLLPTSISVKQQRKKKGVKKQQGHTWVKLNN